MLPGLIIAANSSGAGKTSASIALILALRARGYRVAVAKLGPDFIDAAWLSWAADSPAANLDSRMAGTAGLARVLARLEKANRDRDVIICESAMGLYDGDRAGRGSAAELAAILNLPVLLVLDAKGVGGSIAPMAGGFLSFAPSWSAKLGKPRVRGLLCSRVSGDRHGELLANALRPVSRKYGAPLLGWLPVQDAPALASRHLGLKQASEEASSLDRERARAWMENNCDVDKIIRAFDFPSPGFGRRRERPEDARRFAGRKKIARAAPVIAIARDKAFGFCYADLPALLEENRCRVVFFSPLEDVSLPECDGCYIPGGYPELYGATLSRNLSMLLSLRARVAEGLPIYAECGGFVYLSRGVIDADGNKWPFAGIIPVECVMERRLRALGYRFVRGRGEMAGIVARGHEFHYCGGALPPDEALWEARDSEGRTLDPQGYKKDNIHASWIHLYPEGSRKFWKYWTGKVRNYSERKKLDG